jgi:transketolase
VQARFRAHGWHVQSVADANDLDALRAAAVNGMALHGGVVKPYGSTFLQFADYMRRSGSPR